MIIDTYALIQRVQLSADDFDHGSGVGVSVNVMECSRRGYRRGHCWDREDGYDDGEEKFEMHFWLFVCVVVMINNDGDVDNIDRWKKVNAAELT